MSNRMPAICSWIGNSKPVAAKHYLKVTDEDFTKALDDNQALKSVIESVMHSTEQVGTAEPQELAAVGETAMLADARRCSDTLTTQYPLKDSNLCFWSEGPASWAARRKGLKRIF